MSVIATDTFTDVDGTLLSAHVATTGQSWTKTADSDVANLQIISNAVRLTTVSTTAATRYLLGVSFGNADYTVSATVKLTDTPTANLALWARGASGANTGYCLCRDNGATQWFIRRTVAGVETTLVTSASVPTSSLDDISVSITVSGSGATVSLSATIAISVLSFTETITFSDTDASRIVATGSPGLGLTNTASIGNTTWDDFQVDGTLVTTAPALFRGMRMMRR